MSTKKSKKAQQPQDEVAQVEVGKEVPQQVDYETAAIRKASEEDIDALLDPNKLENSQDRFVWHDEYAYHRRNKLMAAIVIVAAVPAIIFYVATMSYDDAWMFAIAIFAIILIVGWLIFHRRIMDSSATFLRLGGQLYRFAAANRGITRMALDNTAEAPYFQKDFDRAVNANNCWVIKEVKLLQEDKRGYDISATVRKYRSGKDADVMFYLEYGINDMDMLMQEIEARRV